MKKFLQVFILVLGLLVTHNVAQEEDEITFKANDEILNWEAPAEFAELYPYKVGIDQEGSPVCFVPVGEWDIRKVVERGGEASKDFDRYTEQVFERCYDSPRRLGTEQDDVVFVTDMNGYNARQFTHLPTINKFVNFARQLVSVQSRGGKLKAAYVLNGNYLVQIVWNLVRPIIGNIANNVQVFPSNPASWKPTIVKNIGKNNLPEKYGGSPNFKPVEIYGQIPSPELQNN